MNNQNSMNRRQFLKGAALTGAALSFPAIIPSSALGHDGHTAPSERIVMGCIGLGGQGTYNMQAFMHQPDVQIVALCDVISGSDDYDLLYQLQGSQSAGLSPAKKRLDDYYAEQTGAADYKGCATYHDFRELLARPDIDAVTVCTPDHWHGLVSIAAAQAGKDIYCEKPLTNTIAEGRAVCDAVNRYKRILQTGSHERSNHCVRFAGELIRNGRIGKLHTIRVNMPLDNDVEIPPQPVMPVPASLDYDFWLGPTPAVPFTKKRTHFWWRYQLEYGGGEMTDRGAHIIDLAQLALDMDNSGPVEISASGRAPRNGLFNTFVDYTFECTYTNGVKLYGNTNTPRGIKFEGDKGSIFIYIHGGRLEANPASLLTDKILPGEITIGKSPGHHRDFLEAVKIRRQPMATAEIGHRTGTICHLLNIAMQTGLKLQWDPVTEHITNSLEADKMVKRPMRAPWHL